jgi:hypothetical protein
MPLRTRERTYTVSTMSSHQPFPRVNPSLVHPTVGPWSKLLHPVALPDLRSLGIYFCQPYPRHLAHQDGLGASSTSQDTVASLAPQLHSFAVRIGSTNFDERLTPIWPAFTSLHICLLLPGYLIPALTSLPNPVESLGVSLRVGSITFPGLT